MIKKIFHFALIMCLIMPIFCSFVACDKSKNSQPVYAGTNKTIEEALTEVKNGGTIVLNSDIEITKPIVINKKVSLDLYNFTIKNINGDNDDLFDTETKEWSLISVQQGGELTIKNGTLQAEENDCFAIDIKDGAKCIIESGNYVGNISAVYVHTGELIVKGGKFSIQQTSTNWHGPYGEILNCLDLNSSNGTASIIVKGGEFQNFDPANNTAEGNPTNFLADGYVSTYDQNTGYYVVSTSTNN